MILVLSHRQTTQNKEFFMYKKNHINKLLIIFVLAFANRGFCNQKSLTVKITSLGLPSAADEIAVIKEAKNDFDIKQLWLKWTLKSKKRDLSGITVTLSGAFIPVDRTKITDESGEVVFLSYNTFNR